MKPMYVYTYTYIQFMIFLLTESSFVTLKILKQSNFKNQIIQLEKWTEDDSVHFRRFSM